MGARHDPLGKALWERIRSVFKNLPAERRDQEVRLAGDDKIHPRAVLESRPSHLGLAIRPAHHGCHRGIEFLDAAEQCQRGAVLLKCRGRPHDPWAVGQNAPRGFIHKARRKRPQLPEEGGIVPVIKCHGGEVGRLNSPGAPEDLLEVVASIAEGRVRKNPLAEQAVRAQLHQEAVDLEADGFGKAQVGVIDPAGKPFAQQAGFEDAEGDGGPHHLGVGHGDEHDVGILSHVARAFISRLLSKRRSILDAKSSTARVSSLGSRSALPPGNSSGGQIVGFGPGTARLRYWS